MTQGIQFDEKLSRRVRQVYSTADIVAQREAVLLALNPMPGERILDIGSGPGLLAASVAARIGETGSLEGIDISESMVALSRHQCASLPCARFQIGDAVQLPFESGTFDAAVSTQVYEYVGDIDEALRELWRILRPGGRAVILDTDWDSLVWHATNRDRIMRIMAEFSDHCAHPGLPRILAPLLRSTGFRIVGQEVYPLFNPKYHAETYSHGLIDFVATFVRSRASIPPEEIQSWIQEMELLGERDAYFFSLNRYLFLVHKPEGVAS